MGFEQLAALKAKLTEQAKEQAKNEARAKGPRPARQPHPAKGSAKGATNSAAKGAGQNPAKGAEGGRGAKPAGAPRHAAKPATPVDPVVRTFGKLQKRFPLAFPKNPAPKVPLKVGIFEDVLAHATELGLTEAELRDAIRTWCRGARYWACLTEGAPRLDLAGQPAGAVTEADARRGKQLLAGGRRKQASEKASQKAKAQAEGAAAEQAPSASTPEAPARPEGAADV
ncbi:ProQ/FinO family protein [Cupriavidus plantarum]|uniref:ProQ/FinO family protein n=1 Tax=Cupriavidus plantarum TaxID=942865 RepID=UPI000EADFB62|nr:ProQ/FinO family protein [Cupriavidus plantarum]